MAGPPSKSVEVAHNGKTAGYVQVRYLDYTKHNEPRYSWMVRDPDAVAVDGGQDLTLDAQASPDASRAVSKLLGDLQSAGRGFDYEQISGESGTWRSVCSEACAKWASDNLDALEATLAWLPVHDRSGL